MIYHSFTRLLYISVMSLAGDEDFAKALLEQTTALVGKSIAGLRAELNNAKVALTSLQREMAEVKKDNQELKRKLLI